jgi:hypothetical protein
MIPTEITIKTRSILMIALSPLGAFAAGVAVMLVAKGWSTDSSAAWVQAVGSIAAIVAALWISQIQRRHDSFIREKTDAADQRLRHIEAARRELALSSDVFFLMAEFDFLLERIESFIQANFKIELGRWDGNLRELLSLIRYDVADTNEQRAFLRFELRQSILDLMGFLEAPRTLKWNDAFVISFRGARTEAHKLFERCNAELEARKVALSELERKD